MAIEEIVLSVPGIGAERPKPEPEAQSRTARANKRATQIDSKLAASLDTAFKRQASFAFNERGRRRREQQFEHACKNLARKMALEATGGIADRATKHKVRMRLYTLFATVIKTAGDDRALAIRRNRALLAWGFAIGAGLCGGLIAFAWIEGWLAISGATA